MPAEVSWREVDRRGKEGGGKEKEKKKKEEIVRNNARGGAFSHDY